MPVLPTPPPAPCPVILHATGQPCGEPIKWGGMCRLHIGRRHRLGWPPERLGEPVRGGGRAASCILVVDPASGETCGLPIDGDGLCVVHARRRDAGWAPDRWADPLRQLQVGGCPIVMDDTAEPCGRKLKARGVCELHSDRIKAGWSTDELGAAVHAHRNRVPLLPLGDTADLDAEIAAFAARPRRDDGHGARYRCWCDTHGYTPLGHDPALYGAYLAWMATPTAHRPAYARSTIDGALAWLDRHLRGLGEPPASAQQVVADVVAALDRAQAGAPTGPGAGVRGAHRGARPPFTIEQLRALTGVAPTPPTDVARARATWHAARAGLAADGPIAVVDHGDRLGLCDHLGHRVEVAATPTLAHAPWTCPVDAIGTLVVDGRFEPATSGLLELPVPGARVGLQNLWRLLGQIDSGYSRWLRRRAALLCSLHGRLGPSAWRPLVIGRTAIREPKGWLLHAGGARRVLTGRHPIALAPAANPALCPVAAIDTWVSYAGLGPGATLFAKVHRGIHRTGIASASADHTDLKAAIVAAGLDPARLSWHSAVKAFDAIARASGDDTDTTFSKTRTLSHQVRYRADLDAGRVSLLRVLNQGGIR